jgi:hypothetical protein
MQCRLFIEDKRYLAIFTDKAANYCIRGRLSVIEVTLDLHVGLAFGIFWS